MLDVVDVVVVDGRLVVVAKDGRCSMMEIQRYWMLVVKMADVIFVDGRRGGVWWRCQMLWL